MVKHIRQSESMIIIVSKRTKSKLKPRFFNSSTSTENLRFLSIDQALADLANFISTMRSDETLNATGGVILVGGSYAGTMVAWFRQKYPHLVNGAWASSAPLRAKLDFSEYKETVGESIRSVGGEDCFDKIEESFRLVDDYLLNGEIDHLRKLFDLCDDFDGKEKLDIWNFVSTLSDIIAGYVQNHRPGVIETICREIMRENQNATTDVESDELYAFAKFIWRRLFNPNQKCISVNYKKDIVHLQNDDWSSTASKSNIRQWFYQTCTEFGWYQTSASEKQPFGTNFPIDLYLNLCKDMFGDS